MTLEELRRFYEQDKEEYIIAKNKEFLNWLMGAIDNSYLPSISINSLQELIDNIASWYEIKYPEREMELSRNRDIDFERINSLNDLSKVMNIRQLIFRLPPDQLRFIKCFYRSIGCISRDIHDDVVYNDFGEMVGHKTFLFMPIKIKGVEDTPFTVNGELTAFKLFADPNNGQVDVNYDLKDYISDKKITLDELLSVFKEKYNDKLEFTNLEECIYNA